MSTEQNQYTVINSFIQGARPSQADWFKTLNVPEHQATLLLMGDGHGDWTERTAIQVAAFFSEGIQNLPKITTTLPDILSFLYTYAAHQFIECNQTREGGSSIICCLVSETECAVMVRGDSEVVVQHRGELHYIEPFDWSSNSSVALATVMGEVSEKPFKGMLPRKGTLSWENRTNPSFAISSFCKPSVDCVPETIGFIGGEGLSFGNIPSTKNKALMQLCAGIYKSEQEQLNTCVDLHLQGPMSGLTITMASDGVRSKGCYTIDRCLEQYTLFLEDPSLTPCDIISQSLDSIMFHHIGPQEDKNPLKTNVLRQLGCESDDPRGLLHSTTHFLQTMARSDSLDILRAAYDLWLPLVLDKDWLNAIDEQFVYFSNTPTLGDAENPLEFLNRVAVLNLSDDNVSSVRVEFSFTPGVN